MLAVRPAGLLQQSLVASGFGLRVRGLGYRGYICWFLKHTFDEPLDTYLNPQLQTLNPKT